MVSSHLLAPNNSARTPPSQQTIRHVKRFVRVASARFGFGPLDRGLMNQDSTNQAPKVETELEDYQFCQPKKLLSPSIRSTDLSIPEKKLDSKQQHNPTKSSLLPLKNGISKHQERGQHRKRGERCRDDGQVDHEQSPRVVNRASSNRYGGLMVMPKLPTELLQDIQNKPPPRNQEMPVKHPRLARRDSMLLQAIRSYSPSHGVNYNPPRRHDEHVLREIRRREQTNNNVPEENKIEFCIRRRARKRSTTPTESALEENGLTNDITVPISAPGFSNRIHMRIIRSHSDRTDIQKRKDKEITVDFSPRKGSPRRLLTDPAEIEAIVGLTILEEAGEDSAESAEVELESPLRLPLRRQNGVRRVMKTQGQHLLFDSKWTS